jgi:TorA maturation chaperone TorD
MTKCPAMIVHVIFAIIVVALSAVLSSQVKADDASHRTACLQAEYVAAMIMADRLKGVPFAAALNDAEDILDGPNALASRLLTHAYNSPLADFTAQDEIGAALEFAAYVRLTCYHNWPRAN